jgi:hypothetical protein
MVRLGTGNASSARRQYTEYSSIRCSGPVLYP